MTNIPERLKKTLATQLEKYGGVEGYRAEMRRRRNMVKSPTGFGGMTTDRVLKAQSNSVKARLRNAEKLKSQTKDTTPEEN